MNLKHTVRNKNIRDPYRGIKKFKKGYQQRMNLLKDENSDLLVDSHNILNSQKNCFHQLVNAYDINDITWT